MKFLRSVCQMMWGRAVVSALQLLWLLTRSLAEDTSQSNLRPGCSINIFSRYGYLSISMKVIPRNDTDPRWIFREPTVDVFHNLHPPKQWTNEPRSVAPGHPVFEGDFHMEFCDNLRQLLQAYFRDFSFERLDMPWRAFTSSWSRTAIGRHLGINSSYVTGQHCYVLVRVARHRITRKLDPEIPEKAEIDEAVLHQIAQVKVGDSASVLQFIREFGSHYVSSYVTGNSLYQIFVYTPQVYGKIKDRLKTRGVGDLTNTELSSYFSPWYAEHMGTILAASGNASVQSWAADQLRVHFYFFTYPSLLKLHGNTQMLRKLDSLLGNEALLQLGLRTLEPVFKDPAKRKWFTEVIDNQLKLWESNM